MPISALAQAIVQGFKRVEGNCARHGLVAVNAKPRGGLTDADLWYCPTCLEEQSGRQAQDEWVAMRHDAIFKTATLPVRYVGQRFEARTPAQRAVRATVRDFRNFVVGEPCWAALILFGACGTGKTLLASEFAEAWVRSLCRSARYITAKGMISEIQAAYGKEGKSEEGEILRFVQYDLLILDEIDAKPDRENANILLTEVINRRYNDNKPMVVITNQPFDNLRDFVGDRVDSRLHENAFVCAFDWPDFRRAER